MFFCLVSARLKRVTFTKHLVGLRLVILETKATQGRLLLVKSIMFTTLVNTNLQYPNMLNF